jgi:hypothetical protein
MHHRLPTNPPNCNGDVASSTSIFTRTKKPGSVESCECMRAQSTGPCMCWGVGQFHVLGFSITHLFSDTAATRTGYTMSMYPLRRKHALPERFSSSVRAQGTSDLSCCWDTDSRIGSREIVHSARGALRGPLCGRVDSLTSLTSLTQTCSDSVTPLSLCLWLSA